MISIQHYIDSEYKAKLYYKDEFIGECLTELSFLNARVQIKNEQDDNYSFELVKTDKETHETIVSKRIHLSKDGKYQFNELPFDLYWPSYINSLSYLLM